MSDCLVALMGLGRNFQGAQWLREQMEHPGHYTSMLIQKWRRFWSPTQWTVEVAKRDKHGIGLFDVIGPGGFWITVSPFAAEVWHATATKYLCETDTCVLLRLAFHEIAGVIGSDRAIYVSEYIRGRIEEGFNLDQMEESLRKEYGEPAGRIEGAIDMFQPRCYCIDRFEDLKRGEGQRLIDGITSRMQNFAESFHPDSFERGYFTAIAKIIIGTLYTSTSPLQGLALVQFLCTHSFQTSDFDTAAVPATRSRDILSGFVATVFAALNHSAEWWAASSLSAEGRMVDWWRENFEYSPYVRKVDQLT